MIMNNEEFLNSCHEIINNLKQLYVKVDAIYERANKIGFQGLLPHPGHIFFSFGEIFSDLTQEQANTVLQSKDMQAFNQAVTDFQNIYSVQIQDLSTKELFSEYYQTTKIVLTGIVQLLDASNEAARKEFFNQLPGDVKNTKNYKAVEKYINSKTAHLSNVKEDDQKTQEEKKKAEQVAAGAQKAAELKNGEETADAGYLEILNIYAEIVDSIEMLFATHTQVYIKIQQLHLSGIFLPSGQLFASIFRQSFYAVSLESATQLLHSNDMKNSQEASNFAAIKAELDRNGENADAFKSYYVAAGSAARLFSKLLKAENAPARQAFFHALPNEIKQGADYQTLSRYIRKASSEDLQKIQAHREKSRRALALLQKTAKVQKALEEVEAQNVAEKLENGEKAPITDEKTKKTKLLVDLLTRTMSTLKDKTKSNQDKKLNYKNLKNELNKDENKTLTPELQPAIDYLNKRSWKAEKGFFGFFNRLFRSNRNAKIAQVLQVAQTILIVKEHKHDQKILTDDLNSAFLIDTILKDSKKIMGWFEKRNVEKNPPLQYQTLQKMLSPKPKN